MRPLFYFGMLLAAGFGTQFLIRFFRDGDFYLAEFIMGIAGILLILGGLFTKGKRKEVKKQSF